MLVPLSQNTHKHDEAREEEQPAERPSGLKGFYYNPYTQISMVAIVCFTCPGLYNALLGLGGAGRINPDINDDANAALYATYAFFAFFAGSVNNVLGPRLTLFLGTTGYALGLGSYLAMNIHPNVGGFVIAAGAYEGLCAALLWTAEGCLMLAYPTESQKGTFIGVFWAIFNMGGVVGACVSLGQNFSSTVGPGSLVGNGTYIALLVLNICGVFLPLFLADPNKVVRTDGTRVHTPRQPTWKSEFRGLWIALKTDPLIIMLFPMFFASIWYYTWQFNDYNGTLFNIRARSLNNLVYWLAQIFGSLIVGWILDWTRLTRRARAFIGWCILLCLVFFVHGWAYVYQRGYTRESIAASPTRMDIYDHGYAGRILLYTLCGVLDSVWQTTTYWIIGTMSNDAAKLAYFTGFYKSIQAAGCAGAFATDAVKLPYMNIFASTWALLVAGLIFTLPMIHMRVKNHTEPCDEMK
ncbi:MFS general substrate transporter [Heliocybe sulcata]|uniref:MFS general substrate transporter n=1 Tax=Heliocybe sulcata TaxID=5364 RepID=A0A5C3MYR1_9AGAM|nr:MFS general substrate transporter [Heliocybe sulcata]